MSKYADLIRRLESGEGADQNLEVDLCEALDLGPEEYWGRPIERQRSRSIFG